MTEIITWAELKAAAGRVAAHPDDAVKWEIDGIRPAIEHLAPSLRSLRFACGQVRAAEVDADRTSYETTRDCAYDAMAEFSAIRTTSPAEERLDRLYWDSLRDVLLAFAECDDEAAAGRLVAEWSVQHLPIGEREVAADPVLLWRAAEAHTRGGVSAAIKTDAARHMVGPDRVTTYAARLGVSRQMIYKAAGMSADVQRRVLSDRELLISALKLVLRAGTTANNADLSKGLGLRVPIEAVARRLALGVAGMTNPRALHESDYELVQNANQRAHQILGENHDG